MVVGRLFVAVPLPTDTRHALAAVLGERSLPGRLVPPDNWHLTLRFLGDVDTARYERTVAELDQTNLGEAFRVRLGELGAFPRASRATVLWVGFAHGREQLERLADSVEIALSEAGWPQADRPFRAHLTLSRIRPHQDVQSLIESVPTVDVGWMVDRVVVFRSHLGHGPARYEELAAFELG